MSEHIKQPNAIMVDASKRMSECDSANFSYVGFHLDRFDNKTLADALGVKEVEIINYVHPGFDYKMVMVVDKNPDCEVPDLYEQQGKHVSSKYLVLRMGDFDVPIPLSSEDVIKTIFLLKGHEKNQYEFDEDTSFCLDILEVSGELRYHDSAYLQKHSFDICFPLDASAFIGRCITIPGVSDYIMFEKISVDLEVGVLSCTLNGCDYYYVISMNTPKETIPIDFYVDSESDIYVTGEVHIGLIKGFSNKQDRKVPNLLCHTIIKNEDTGEIIAEKDEEVLTSTIDFDAVMGQKLIDRTFIRAFTVSDDPIEAIYYIKDKVYEEPYFIHVREDDEIVNHKVVKDEIGDNISKTTTYKLDIENRRKTSHE